MPQPLFLSYFSGRVSYFCLGLASDCDPPTYNLLCSWDRRCRIPHLACQLRWGGLVNFLPRLASNYDPPDIHLLSSWDYRHGHYGQPSVGVFYTIEYMRGGLR
jgi:hypothetical protein